MSWRSPAFKAALPFENTPMLPAGRLGIAAFRRTPLAMQFALTVALVWNEPPGRSCKVVDARRCADRTGIEFADAGRAKTLA